MSWRNRFLKWLRSPPKTSGPNAVKNSSSHSPRICRFCRGLTSGQEAVCQTCKKHDPSTTVQALDRTEAISQTGSWPIAAIFATIGFVYMVSLALSLVDNTYNALENWWAPSDGVLIMLGTNHADLTLNGAQYWRLITSIFLHNNLIHVGFCLLFFAKLGPPLHQQFGMVRFWIILTISGITGSIFSADAVFLGVPTFQACGFSPVLFGILGCQWVSYSVHPLQAEQAKSLLGWGFLLFLGLSLIGITPIDHMGHLGGMLAGMGLGYWFQSNTKRQSEALLDRLALALVLLFLAWGWYHVFLNIENLL